MRLERSYDEVDCFSFRNRNRSRSICYCIWIYFCIVIFIQQTLSSIFSCNKQKHEQEIDDEIGKDNRTFVKLNTFNIELVLQRQQ